MNKINYFLHNPKVFLEIGLLKLLKYLPDEEFLKIKYRFRMRKRLNLKNPQTYNEKLQWLKLYDRKPIYTNMVDKAEAKEYVAELIGNQYIIPTYGVWDKWEDIDFEKLPDQFVLKTTHDSGGVAICKNKSTFDFEGARRKLTKSLRHNYFLDNREWPYKNVPHRLLAEKYMEDETGELRDFKFFAFGGKVKALFIATERFKKGEDTKFDFFDENFKHLPFTNGHPNADHTLPEPPAFEKMKELAEKLSKGIPQLRVDFYNINGKIYFGELTFFHWSGIMPFVPEEWDFRFGQWIKLPVNSNAK